MLNFTYEYPDDVGETGRGKSEGLVGNDVLAISPSLDDAEGNNVLV